MFKKLLLGEYIGVLPLLLGAGGLPTWSQTEFPLLGSTLKQMTQEYTIVQTFNNPTAKDLEKFAQTVKKQRNLAQDTKEKILEVLDGEGLSRQRFREIAQRKSTLGVSIEDFSDEDFEKFKNVFPKVKKIAQEDLLKQKRLIRSQGFTIQEFNAIATEVQNNPSLQREVLRLIRD
ncbi:DUF4168 domain-containing protein [Cyanobacterium sp. uoEpiScrs1]|uniref:DUF4168 domain-containing protein n=1 Tax=Cyanobacterium sp. uoEpiScrs1 TaxID=2976343 RepID=UPI00226A1789|nr:DUF4168 domain-containing protein [Cyanobacterium sp. uoEpiScrs1]